MHYTGKTYVSFFFFFLVVKRLPEHIQVDNPEVLKKLAKKLERQQVSFFFLVMLIWFYSILGMV